MEFDMRWWRWCTCLIWLVLLGLPLFAIGRELEVDAGGWLAWREWDRLLELGWKSLALMLGTAVLALPLGCGAGLLLYRSDLPCRQVFRRLIVFALFIPLPLLASAWKSALLW